MTKKRALVATILVAVLGIVVASLVLGNRNGVTGLGSATSGVAADEAGGGSGDSGSSALKTAPDTGARQAVATAPMTRKVISTGQVTLRAENMGKARSEAIRLVTSWGGSVADEQSSSDKHGRLSESILTLRVPSDHFYEAMSAFSTLGKVEQRSQKSEDVTTKVIDTDARVRAGERSIQQIEALLSRAQKLGDIIAIENDLARRQADLDSLKSQQAWLEDQTSLSTVTVYLFKPVVAHRTTHEAKGFLSGLENGWHALGATTTAALTAFGAVLPFAVLIALFGVPVWWVVRRRRTTSSPVAPAAGA
jgi:Domain of unknown function (DUF4349)